MPYAGLGSLETHVFRLQAGLARFGKPADAVVLG